MSRVQSFPDPEHSPAGGALPGDGQSEPGADGVARFGELCTRAPRMQEAFQILAVAAESESNLLLQGETGVGKEVLAEAVHHASQRRSAPFMVFDCAEKSPDAAARELFGNEPAPAVSAPDLIRGYFELADGGTLVLDHIDALAPHLQSALLRALEKRRVLRVHGSSAIPFDVRLMAITSENLALAVRRGKFREDLYTKISELAVTVPPLRRRLVDLDELMREILAECSPPRSLGDIPQRILPALRTYRWPGNIRELRNLLMRGLVMPERWLLSTRRRSGSE